MGKAVLTWGVFAEQDECLLEDSDGKHKEEAHIEKHNSLNVKNDAPLHQLHLVVVVEIVVDAYYEAEGA